MQGMSGRCITLSPSIRYNEKRMVIASLGCGDKRQLSVPKPTPAEDLPKLPFARHLSRAWAAGIVSGEIRLAAR